MKASNQDLIFLDILRIIGFTLSPPCALWPTKNREGKEEMHLCLFSGEEECLWWLDMDVAQNSLDYLFTLPPRMCFCGSHQGWGGQTSADFMACVKCLYTSRATRQLQDPVCLDTLPHPPAPSLPTHTNTFLCPLIPPTHRHQPHPSSAGYR